MAQKHVQLRTGTSIMGIYKLVVAAVLLTACSASMLAQGPPAGAPGGGRGPGGPGGAPPPPPPPTAGMKLEIIPDGSSASYNVREQFIGIDFPNDAVGTTTGVAGNIVIAADGTIPAGSSKLTIDLKGLKSDQDQRDGYVKSRVLETDKFPTAEFVPTKLSGVPVMIPSAGQTGVALTGNLTIKGVTKEVTFKGIATFNNRDSTVAGRAETSFTFDTFGLTAPKIGRLASVDNNVKLALIFRFKRS